jgi:DNA-directed RNA polymerase subunit RPC12/RpoP
MSYKKYQYICTECDTEVTVFVYESVEDAPQYCPICGVAIINDDEDDEE